LRIDVAAQLGPEVGHEAADVLQGRDDSVVMQPGWSDDAKRADRATTIPGGDDRAIAESGRQVLIANEN